MSTLNRNLLPFSVDYNELVRRDSNPWGNIGAVHPQHPMRLMETIRVGSLSEMRGIIRASIDLNNQNRLAPEVNYSIFPSGPKPVVDIVLDNELGSILVLASTIEVTLESFEAASEKIKALVWRKIDVVESFIWYGALTSNGFFVSPPNPITSFRELFAFGRAFLMRVTPGPLFTALMTPRAYGAMLLDNAAGVNNDNSYTENHASAGAFIPVPIAINYGQPWYPTDERVAIYNELLPSVCKRYIIEAEHVNNVRDYDLDRNLVRITCERYMAPIIPLDFYFNGTGLHVAPVVVISAQDAIASINTKYGSGTLANLDYFASAV